VPPPLGARPITVRANPEEKDERTSDRRNGLFFSKKRHLDGPRPFMDFTFNIRFNRRMKRRIELRLQAMCSIILWIPGD
jgi:hypothetical protein